MREAERGVIEPGMEGKVEYQKTVEEVVAGLRSDARRGLSTEEARSRLERYGPNELEAEKTVAAHLSNIYGKLSVKSRVQLASWLKENDSESFVA